MYEMLVGLEITNDEIYEEYRDHMKPILIKYKGGFRVDFKLDRILLNDSENQKLNRLFIIYFESKTYMEDFFANSDYLKVKKKFFDDSVGEIEIISEYLR